MNRWVDMKENGYMDMQNGKIAKKRWNYPN